MNGSFTHGRQSGVVIVIAAIALALPMSAQGTAADYTRADSLNRRFQNLVANVAEKPTWLDATRFWYRKSVVGGNSFVLVDTKSSTKSAAFDHARLAHWLEYCSQSALHASHASISTDFTYDGTTAIRFVAAGSQYSCTIADYACSRIGAAPSPTFGGAGRGGIRSFSQSLNHPPKCLGLKMTGLKKKCSRNAHAQDLLPCCKLARRSPTRTLCVLQTVRWKRTSTTTMSLFAR